MFLDEIRLTVRGGKGGDGLISFFREKYRPKGGPSGGDGGDGGDVVLIASHDVHGFHGLRGKKTLKAKGGEPGGIDRCGGKDAENLVIRVPIGTEVKDAATGVVLKDLATDGDQVTIVEGGRGGRGNARFAHSTRQTPRFSEKGEEGGKRALILSVKLIADVGLVGLPNAGKSTLLRSLSRSKTKIAGYQFTTLGPHLGVVELSPTSSITFADLPGLIEGAHEGRGLGDRFLKHVERTRILVHMVAHDPVEGAPPADEAWRIVRKELAAYSPELASKAELTVLSKCDLPGWEESLNLLRRASDADVTVLSAVTGLGVDELLRRIARALEPA
jgi:GTP-binding protein